MDPTWKGNYDVNRKREALEKAVNYAKEILQGMVANLRDEYIPAKEVVEEGFKQRISEHSSGRILVLRKFVPWRDHVYEIETKMGILPAEQPHWIVFQDERSLQWRATAIACKGERFANRALIREDWRGLRDEELKQKTCLNDANFVHHSGFTCGAASKSSVITLITS